MASQLIQNGLQHLGLIELEVIGQWMFHRMPMSLPISSDFTDEDAISLIQCLPELSARLRIVDGDQAFIRRFLRRKDVQMTMKIYKRLSLHHRNKVRAITMSSVTLAANVFCYIRNLEKIPEVESLIQLLSKPHVQAMLYAHDKVATKEYGKDHADENHVTEDIDGSEERVRIVQLVKKNEPLGVTIQRREKSHTIEIARIIHGGAAHRSGLMHEGDEIYEINGIQFVGRDPNDMAQLLSRLSGSVTLKLGPNSEERDQRRASNTRVRALFDYNPYEDPLIPCPNAGLSFRKGDILHIVKQDDHLWWQAKYEGAGNSKAGLVPSRILQERRELLRKGNKEDDGGKRRRSRSLSPCRLSPRIPRSKRVRKMMYQSVHNSEFEHGDIPTYEEVELLASNRNRLRPLILIGAPNVGRNELKRRLIACNPSHFVDIVPYTSRPKRPEEEEGREYHFVTRREMESGILARRFVEHGEFKGNLYGTRTDSIQSVINSGRVCILTPSAKAIPYLRTPDIRPYIIFIRAPSLTIMRETRQHYSAMVTSDTGNTFLFTDEDLSTVVSKSARIEEQYSHWFDKTIVNDDLQSAVKELIEVSKTVELEPQWVPVTWI